MAQCVKGRFKILAAIILIAILFGNYYLWFYTRLGNSFQSLVPKSDTNGVTNASTNTRMKPKLELKQELKLKQEFHLMLKYVQPCKLKETKTETFRHLEVKLHCIHTSEPCYGWHWDVANWTIIHSNVDVFTLQNASNRLLCPKPVNGVRTARIVHRSGKVEYPDCSNDKYPCAPFSLLAAHFDKGLNMRINSSPCCRKQNIDVTQHMARVFDQYNITYLLVGGAVIGLQRDGGSYVPYDTDLDVGVDANDYDKIIKAFPDLRKTGYIFKWVTKEEEKTRYESDGRKWYMVGCVNSKCHTGPGIALYSREGDKIVARTPPWTYPVNITIPPIRRMFEGMEMSFPKEPSKYLDFVYGKGKWETPRRCTKHYYEQCAE